jgi:6-pyruvoyltetrahydropterin/6-carboxytetrahydropterin synthase
MYRVTKHYGHELGLSCVFRQWRADSHCAQLHGYALAFTFVFEANELDTRGWVVDFGALGQLKSWLQGAFDHVILVAQDDPCKQDILGLKEGIATVMQVPATGCEAFALMAYERAKYILEQKGLNIRVRVVSCTVHEHGANSATYTQDPEVQV